MQHGGNASHVRVLILCCAYIGIHISIYMRYYYHRAQLTIRSQHPHQGRMGHSPPRKDMRRRSRTAVRCGAAAGCWLLVDENEMCPYAACSFKTRPVPAPAQEQQQQQQQPPHPPALLVKLHLHPILLASTVLAPGDLFMVGSSLSLFALACSSLSPFLSSRDLLFFTLLPSVALALAPSRTPPLTRDARLS